MTDTVAAAAAAVDYDAWVKADNGYPIPQSTADALIHTMLDRLDLRPGARVMEIGTGSGYSGALLSRIVGEDGHVVSIDIDPSLTERASRLHEQAGHNNIEVHAADGFAGWGPVAPFERIVGWTTPHVLPAAWVEQAAVGAVILTPVKVADVACANMLVRCVVDGGIREGELFPGNFIELADFVITEFALPVRYIDASHRVDGGPPWWISARALHDESHDVAVRLLDQARESEAQAGFLLVGREKWEAFNAFVLACTETPASLGGRSGWGIGVAKSDSIAVVLPNGTLVAAGSGQARDELAALVSQWRGLGEPGYADVVPVFTNCVDGWSIHAKPRDPR